jgi:hypothetical protein
VLPLSAPERGMGFLRYRGAYQVRSSASSAAETMLSLSMA